MSDTLELTSAIHTELKFEGDSPEYPTSTVNETLELTSKIEVQLEVVSKVDNEE